MLFGILFTALPYYTPGFDRFRFCRFYVNKTFEFFFSNTIKIKKPERLPKHIHENIYTRSARAYLYAVFQRPFRHLAQRFSNFYNRGTPKK